VTGTPGFGTPFFGAPFDPYVIAEIGVNHGGDLGLARRLIDLAHEGGAHAAKFQTYKAGKLASRHSPAYWDTTKEPATSQHDLFARYDAFGPEEYGALADHCRKVGIDFLSTPFDLEAVDLLDPLVPAFKVASADITNVPLLRAVAGRGKPVLLSTGASTLPEVAFALATVRGAGAREVALLHCVLNYPTPYAHAELGTIRQLIREFPDVAIGYSDHTVPTPGMEVLQTAVLLGATVLEKHFTHDKTLPGNDHYHAMDLGDLRHFLAGMAFQRTVLGGGTRTVAHEAAARAHARRSLVAARALKAGAVLSERDLIAKRPGHGISPIHWDAVIGSRLVRDVPEDALLSWEDLDGPEEARP
jgi:sialic acid synthase SpsE